MCTSVSVCTAVRLVAVKHYSMGQWSKQILEALCRQMAILGMGWPRDPGMLVYQLDQRLWVTWSQAVATHMGSKLVPVKSWLPHTTGPPTKACPGSLVAGSHLRALRLGTAHSLKSPKFALF